MSKKWEYIIRREIYQLRRGIGYNYTQSIRRDLKTESCIRTHARHNLKLVIIQQYLEYKLN